MNKRAHYISRSVSAAKVVDTERFTALSAFYRNCENKQTKHLTQEPEKRMGKINPKK